MIGNLSRFVIGYDRAYIGAELHCLDCIAMGMDEMEGLHEVTDANLEAVIAFALGHQLAKHPRKT